MIWKLYPKYKDSGVEWLGKVPEEWRVSRLKYIAAKKKFAIVDGPFGTQLKSEDYRDSGIPLIRISNLSYEGKFNSEDLVFIDPNKALEVDRSKISQGDIVVGKTGATIGKSALIRDFDYAIIASSCIKVSPDINFVTPEFLINFVISDDFIKEIINTSGGSTRDTINILPFSNLNIVIPNIEEQKTISIFLDRETAKLDTLIAKQERLIELLQEKRKALISHAVTKGLNPEVPMKDSGVEWLGQVPEHWMISKLKYVAQLVMGQSPPSEECNIDGEGFPFLQGCAEFGSVSPEPLQYCSVATKFAQKGTILFSVRAPVGSINIANQLYGIGRGLCAIQASMIDELFLEWSIKSNKEQLFALATGSTYEAVTIGEVKNMLIPLPNIKEQQAIASFLDRETAKLDTLIEKSRRSIELIKEHRSALISAAVTGKIDVREESV